MREVRWERMFPDQLERAFSDCPVVYFAYGLCEPHGPQNALGLDALKAHAICCRAAERFGGIVAPCDFWHIHELGGSALWARKAIGEVERSWLTCMPPWEHFKNVCYHVRQAEAIGFHAAILFTGHYGPNWEDLNTLVRLIQPHVGTRLYSLPEFEANKPGFDGDGASGDHAGKMETSLLWALMPECTDVSRLPDRTTGDAPWAMGRNAYEANRRTGERMVEDEAAWLGNKAQELLRAYDEMQPTHRLRTFEDVERLWDEVVRPHFRELRSMQDYWGEPEEVPANSVWHANWRVPDRS